MANTIFTQVSTLNKGINEFGSFLPFLPAVSTEFIPEPIVGTALEVSVFSATAQGGAFNGSYDSSGSALTKVSVPLTHIFQSFDINITEQTTNAAARLENLYTVNLNAFAKLVAKEVLKDVGAYTTSGSATGFGYDTVKSIAGQLNTLNVTEPRYLLVDTTIAGGLYVSSSMATAVNVQNYDFVAAPKVSTGILPSGVKGVALAKSTYAMANALPVDPLAGTNGYIDEQVITDPVSGITFKFKVFALPNSGTKRGVFECLCGGKTAVNAGVKIV